MKSAMNPVNIAICITIVMFSLGSVICQSQINDMVDAGTLGKIQGLRLTTVGSAMRPYVGFSGIRFASQVSGNNRFKPSTMSRGNLSDGKAFFDAKIAGLSCSQPDVVVPLPQTEDCLFLNVYSPNPNASAMLPVLVFIHGGAFTAGSGALYMGNRLLNRDIVLVSINYRLGAFGFFTLNNEDVPGNAGLYDMLNALKWVKEFIVHFGGDPDKVTISGQSSGSVAVTHLLASPLAKPYFRSVIGASGTALSSWGTATPGDAMVSSLRLSEIAGCYNSSDGYPDEQALSDIARCMRTVEAPVLLKAMTDFQVEERKEGRLGFAAVSAVVQEFPASPTFERIVPEHPMDVYEAGKQADVPLMMGTCRHDGAYVLGVLYQRYLVENGYVNNTEFMSNQVVSKLLQAVGIPDEFGVHNSMAKLYLGDTRKDGIFNEMYPGLIDLCSTFFFKAPAYQTALYHSRLNNNRTYWYGFDYYGRYTMFGILFGLDRPPIRSGISHGDDLIYLFQTSLPLNAPDMAMADTQVDYWANFVIYGRPTGPTPNAAWPHLSPSDPKFLSIGSESLVLDHFEDYWMDVGWEVLRPTVPTSEPTEPTTPITGGNARASSSVSYSFYSHLITLLIVVFSFNSQRN